MNLRRITASKVKKVLIVNSDPEILNILEVNMKHANLEVLTARNGREALGKVNTDNPDIILIDNSLPDIEGVELCQKLRTECTHHIPMILIGAKTQKKDRNSKVINGADSYVYKPFDPKEVVNLVLAYLIQKERVENLNPLTGLPDQTQISNEITRLIAQKKTFAAVYIAMDDLKAFNKVYGYDQGDRTIRLLADIVSEAVRLFGNPDDLVGHLGGDKFVVISTPWKSRPVCRRIIADFNRRVRALYTDEHLQRGYITYESPSGEESQGPIMSLRVAVVTNQKRTFYHHLEVNEAGSEQLDYLSRFPGGKSYFDLQASGYEPDDAIYNRTVLSVRQDEVKALHGLLAWFDFLIKELDSPITSLKYYLESMEHVGVENLTFEQQNSLGIIRENIRKLDRAVCGLEDLTRSEWQTADYVFEEVNVGNTLGWIMEQTHDLAEQRQIVVDISGAENIDRILVDRRNFTQAFFYIVRGEIQNSPPQSHIDINVSEKNGEFISIHVNNTNHYVSQHALAMLLKGQRNGVAKDEFSNNLYPVKLLVESLGGKLSVVSEKGKGIDYHIIIPKKWPSWMQEVNTLRLAVDISRKEARTELRNINHELSLLLKEVPKDLRDNLEKLSAKTQELGVLCNRSLFLVDDINNRLEAQQDRLLQQETEQLATSESILTICHDIAQSMQLEHIFDSYSVRQVAKNSLAIGKEFKLSESDLLALHHAALLKDLGLVLSPSDLIEQGVVTTTEEANNIRTRFNSLWKALSNIPFLSQALVFILYEYERYNGKSGSLGVRGDSIPLGARILSIANTFEYIMSGRSPQGGLAPRSAVQKIVNDSGMRFDPHVVSAFLMIWKKRELDLKTNKS